MANELEIEIEMLRQAIVAKAVRESLGELTHHNGPMSHSHHCRHCDVVLKCSEAECTLPPDLSKLHQCGERQQYNRRMRRLMGRPDCKFGCKGDCSHPRKELYIYPEDTWDYMHPQVVVKIGEFAPMRFQSGYAGTHSEDCTCNKCKTEFRTQPRI